MMHKANSSFQLSRRSGCQIGYRVGNIKGQRTFPKGDFRLVAVDGKVVQNQPVVHAVKFMEEKAIIETGETMDSVYIDQNGKLFGEGGERLTYFIEGYEEEDVLLSDFRSPEGLVIDGDVRGRIGETESGILTKGDYHPCRTTANVQMFQLIED